jgi:hypothetical protein
MTVVAVWQNNEEPERPTLWMASDSRISDGVGPLIDEGIKLYELPVICRKPGASGIFDTPYFATTIGIACAGGTLIYQHVYATLVPIFANLIGTGEAVPSVAGLASFAGAITSAYVRSLGGRRPHATVSVSVVVAGHFPGHPPDAFELRPELEHADSILAFAEHKLDLTEDRVHFLGDQRERAQQLLADFRADPRPGVPFERAPLNVIRALIEAPDAPSVGGEVQIGFTTGIGFQRVTTVVPAAGQAPRALSLLNSLDLDTLPPIGPCRPGLPGMISP